jgi:hypothetical protein
MLWPNDAISPDANALGAASLASDFGLSTWTTAVRRDDLMSRVTY